MYIDASCSKQNGKIYRRYLLRESYREGGKVMHRTIANLSGCSEQEIEAMKLALKHKNDLTQLKVMGANVESEQGPCIGAVLLLKEMAERLHITRALGNSLMGRMALWQVMARIIDQGSRLSAVRLAQRHAVAELLDLEEFNEDDLYENLDWLSENQAKIEINMFRLRYKDREKPRLYLYDVTSSYLEGIKNELGDWGYNRDKKKGKLQIVIGLLVDNEGVPVSVEVFAGNTNDTKTVLNQIKKIAGRFGIEDVTMVGDRGMIKSTQIENLKEAEFHYITAITKAQIETLIKRDIIQMEMFDGKICEVVDNGIRYIVKRNPLRTQEMTDARNQKVNKVLQVLSEQNTYLAEHQKADVLKAKAKIDNLIDRLKLSKYVSSKANDRELILDVDNEKEKEGYILDGCYVIKTDLKENDISSENIHDRYKDLALVERSFRTMKTGFLETRPIFVRKERRTRGHVFVVMLAYIITHKIEQLWAGLDITVEEAISELSTISSISIKVGEAVYHQIPKPRGLGSELLQLANVNIPSGISPKDSKVATRRKLMSRRKQ